MKEIEKIMLDGEEADFVQYAKREEVGKIQEQKVDENKVATYITPEMFGAIGDGVTDDSEAIQQAIDEAGGTKVVYLHKKNYAISTGLIITENYSQFVCDGTLIYSGIDSAVTLTGTLRSEVKINSIYAEKGTAIRLSNVKGRVTFNQVSVNNIRSSKVGIHLTTPTIDEPIYYNKITYMDIIATEIGIHVEPISYLINENRYYGGTIGGGCVYGIKIGKSDTEINGNTSSNKFLSGGIEGIADNGWGIYLENSNYNIFKNIRTLERTGKYILGFKGISHSNNIEVSVITISQIDISEIGDIGVMKNTIYCANSSFDGSTRLGNVIEVSKLGFVYDTKKSTTSENHIKISLANFPDGVIKPINNRIYTSFQSTVASLNGETITLGEVYYGINSMIKGEPIVIWFSEAGKIKLVDIDGTEIFDNTDGKFNNKTISIKWSGFDAHNSKNIWDISVVGQYGRDGKDGVNGYTPVKGTDYFTAEDIQQIVNSVYAKVADGNEVSY